MALVARWLRRLLEWTDRPMRVGLVVLSCAAPAAWAQSIDALLDAGRADEALPRIEARLSANPRDAEALLQRSTARFIRGDREAGRRDLLAALEIDPELRQGWLNRGALALAEGDLDSAVAAFQRAQQLDPEALDGPLNLGVALLMQGDLEGADRQFAGYLARSRGSGEAHYLVATNYAMMGYSGLSLRHLAQAIQRDEQTRLRARTDPNWRALAADPAYVALLNTDSYTQPAGALQAAQDFDAAYAGGDGPMLRAVMTALQEAEISFEPQVEVTPQWALLWGRARIKVAAVDPRRSRIEVTAPAGSIAPGEWRSLTEELFRRVTVQLTRLRRPGSAPAEGTEP